MLIPELDQAVSQLRDIADLVEEKLHHNLVSDEIKKAADHLNEVLNAIL